MLAERVSKAHTCSLHMRALGVWCAGIRFVMPSRWHAMSLRHQETGCDGWLDADGKRLQVPATLSRLRKIKLQRPLVDTPVTAHLVLGADKHWYTPILRETVPQHEQELDYPVSVARMHPALGLDMGSHMWLADSERAVVENPRHCRHGPKRLTQARCTVCRHTSGGHRRRRAA